jgi:bifunctional non-homologous end joining protein LigD
VKHSLPRLETITPQLATVVDRPPGDGRWVFEVKFDGYRMLARIQGRNIALRSRNNLDWTTTFPHIRAALLKLNRSAILDGEVCYVLKSGLTSFQKLQQNLPRGGGVIPRESQGHLAYYIFDVLFLDDNSFVEKPLLERKRALRGLLGKKHSWPLIYSDHLEADGHTALAQACQAGLEGLIAKRVDAPYRRGRGTAWLKLKCHKRQEFVIVGMLPPEGARVGFRSLLLASRSNGILQYNGKVGTGFDTQLLNELSLQLRGRVVKEPPVANPPRLKNVIWVRPDLVCEVTFTEMTADGSLRHPSFQGLRRDKSPSQVVRETPRPVEQVTRRAARRPSTPTSKQLIITHPERVLDAASGVTKGELASYHQSISSG